MGVEGKFFVFRVILAVIVLDSLLSFFDCGECINRLKCIFVLEVGCLYFVFRFRFFVGFGFVLGFRFG